MVSNRSTARILMERKGDININEAMLSPYCSRAVTSYKANPDPMLLPYTIISEFEIDKLDIKVVTLHIS